MPRAKAKRYFTSGDEHGATLAQIKRLSKAKQLEYITDWFFRNFEDPANETPYESAEGGYQYIWGGPYDAHEEIESEFGNVISEDVIDLAVRQVEAHGLEWAPGPDHPNKRQADEDSFALEDTSDTENDQIANALRWLAEDAPVAFETPHAIGSRNQLIKAIEGAEDAIRNIEAIHGRIGHNRPPPDDGDVPAKVLASARDDTSEIKSEITRRNPDPLKIGYLGLRVRKAGKWIIRNLDACFSSFTKSFGTTLGGAAAVYAVGGGASDFVSLIERFGRSLLDVSKAVYFWVSAIQIF